MPHSNLLFVAVSALCHIEEFPISLVPQEIDYNQSLSCYKVHHYDLNRKRSRVCYNHHHLVSGDIFPSKTIRSFTAYPDKQKLG